VALTFPTVVFIVTTVEGKGGYGAALERAMSGADVSARRLAGLLRPDSPESMRRLIRRYLKGERIPSQSTQEEIIEVLKDLGADTAELEAEGDDESLVRALMGRLSMVMQPTFERFVREELAELRPFTGRNA
jgi:hypothetical protein